VARVIETGPERAEQESDLLASLRASYPHLDFHRLPGAWLALPKGTPFESAFTLFSLGMRLPAGELAQ
jgi:hypothetical protein